MKKMSDFQLFSYEEEKKLTIQEQKEYYIFLKEFLKKAHEPNSKKILNKIREVLNKKIVRDIIDEIKGYELEITGQENILKKPVIYATTHQDFYDHFNIVLSIPDHAIILNNINVSKIVKLAMNINGIQYVNRDDYVSKYNAKINLMKYISKGKSIVIFPEATYNCSPNKLVLPFHSGVIDISRKMQTPIIPVVQEYLYENNKVKKCFVHFGYPIKVEYDDNKLEKKEELRESFATIRYNLIEKKGLYSRNSINESEYIDYLTSKLKLLELVHSSYEIEEKSIYDYNNEFYQYFPLNAVDIEKAQKKLLLT